MGIHSDNVSWSITVYTGNQLHEIREELDSLMTQKRVNGSTRILIATALSEICRSLMMQFPEFSFLVSSYQKGPQTGISFEFRITKPNGQTTSSSNHSQNWAQIVDLKKFENVFDELNLHPGNQHSDPSLTLIRWLTDQ